MALISDSCFSGDILDPMRGITPEMNADYFKNAYSGVSRQVLTSGASESVPDASEFSAQLKLVLEGNEEPFLDPLMIYDQIRRGVKNTTPLFGDLKDSGHQRGAAFLFFLKRGNRGANKKNAGDTEKPSPPDDLRSPKLSSTIGYGSIDISARLGGRLSVDGKEIGPIEGGATIRLDDVAAGERSLELVYEDEERETLRVLVETASTTKAVFNHEKDSLPKASRIPEGLAVFHPAVPFQKRPSISWNGVTYSAGGFFSDHTAFALAVEKAFNYDPELMAITAKYKSRMLTGKILYFSGLGGMLVTICFFGELSNNLPLYIGIESGSMILSVIGGLMFAQSPETIIDFVNSHEYRH